jgi:hypothetical protein
MAIDLVAPRLCREHWPLRNRGRFLPLMVVLKRSLIESKQPIACLFLGPTLTTRLVWPRTDGGCIAAPK